SSVVIAGLLVDSGWSGRQLIVKSIEQNAFAAGDQPFDIGPPEVEVPGLGIFELLIPVADAGKRCIHNNPSGNPSWVKGCKRIADHVADVVGDQCDIPNPQLVENTREVVSLRSLFVPTILMG